MELTGALAGYTLAMRNTGMIAMAGLITGISATLSMASSGFLSAREAGEKDAVKSSIYTGVAYLITVATLIAPYLIAPQNGYFGALVAMLLLALMIIAGVQLLRGGRQGPVVPQGIPGHGGDLDGRRGHLLRGGHRGQERAGHKLIRETPGGTPGALPPDPRQEAAPPGPGTGERTDIYSDKARACAGFVAR